MLFCGRGLGWNTSRRPGLKCLGLRDVFQPKVLPIIQSLPNDDFSLLFSANPFGLSLAKNELRPGEVGALVSPFFYQNRQHSFFVEPSLTEETKLEKWEGWGLDPVLEVPGEDIIAHTSIDPKWEEPLSIDPNPLGLDPSGPIEVVKRFKEQMINDLITHSSTAVRYNNVLIGKAGGLAGPQDAIQSTRFSAVAGNGITLNAIGAARINQGNINIY